MDLSKISLWIGLIALLLAVPLAVVANLLTPQVRDWYSATSEKRTWKRLAEVEKRLHEVEGLWVFTPGEWDIYAAQASTTRILFLAIHLGWSLVLLGLLEPVPWLKEPLRSRVSLFVLVGYSINVFYVFRFVRNYNRNRETHSTDGREELKEELRRLQDRVAGI